MPAGKRLACLVLLVLSLSAAPLVAQTLDLLGAYQTALSEDAEYQAARAMADSERELVPMARAQLLPNVSANATRMHNDLTSTTTHPLTGAPNTTESTYPSWNYALVARQPLYRPALLAGYRQSLSRLSSSEAALDKARQSLGVRVANAYFGLLLAEEGLRQTLEQKKIIEAQLAAARLALSVGHGTRTDVDDAQARLDMNRSRLLSAELQIERARHEIAILLNRPVSSVAPLAPARLLLQAPLQDDLDEWVARALENSPEIRDLQARVEAARYEVERARAGHKPTLDLVVQRSVSASDNVTNPNSRYDNRQIGVQLAIPLFAGGYVNAQTSQAQNALLAAEHAYEAARRRMTAEVRKEFYGVREGALRVKALEQAERSAEQSVVSNEKGFQAGVRSRLDILAAADNRAAVRMELTRARIDFILSRVRLLSLCGALDIAEFESINAWLQR